MKLITQNFTSDDHARKTDKAKSVTQALQNVKKGEDGNVINACHIFEAQLWLNNPEAWAEMFDTQRKNG